MTNRYNVQPRTTRIAVLALTVVAMSGCSDKLFSVTNPGRIQDDDLNNPQVVDALVTGMSHDFSVVHDNNAVDVAMLSDEMAGTGNYEETRLEGRGIARREDFNYNYEALHRARWVAETGIERMKAIEGFTYEGNRLSGRANLFAGMSNRMLGELFCAVTYDGSAALPKSAAFERAIPFYEEALHHAELAGDQALIHAALGGLAQTYLALGDGAKAAEYAAQVPTDFVQFALYSPNSSDEESQVWSYTHGRNEMSAYNTFAVIADDPRAPYTDCTDGSCKAAESADGSSPHYRQEKYPEVGSDIPVVKGTEMRLIQAEVAIQAGRVDEAMQHINEVRSVHGLDPLNASNAESAMEVLKQERFLTLWLEGRRLFDLDRWDDPFLQGGTIFYPGVAERARCIPLPETECDTNPKVACTV
ncbi:MAG TPA: RagB/SusD family nutrient uptake outer membrane protein [Longimicrobiaceae bacterium]|nr:RagB/SusD family nutrient uptake outer membrane protein [Longimicrobiaceae bacterium]